MNKWLLRIALSSVLLFHGIGKVTMGIDGFAAMFNLNIIAAYLATFAELAGGVGILVGGFKNPRIGKFSITQWGTLAATPVILGAIILVHAPNGYSFMNNGWEFQSVLLLLTGYLFLDDK
jgi:putative oxidoreductase